MINRVFVLKKNKKQKTHCLHIDLALVFLWRTGVWLLFFFFLNTCFFPLSIIYWSVLTYEFSWFCFTYSFSRWELGVISRMGTKLGSIHQSVVGWTLAGETLPSQTLFPPPPRSCQPILHPDTSSLTHPSFVAGNIDLQTKPCRELLHYF